MGKRYFVAYLEGHCDTRRCVAVETASSKEEAEEWTELYNLGRGFGKPCPRCGVPGGLQENRAILVICTHPGFIRGVCDGNCEECIRAYLSS